MYHPDLDGEFYEIAMSFFVETGHISDCEPEYANYDPAQITESVRKYDLDKNTAFSFCENISLLFAIHQCMFFSVELCSERRNRSSIAKDIHRSIHSIIEMEASICVFRCANEVLFSFMRHKDCFVISDWYQMDDIDGELLPKLDISNISVKSDYDYFCDLAYSLEREKFRLCEDELCYQLYPADSIYSMKLVEQEDEEIDDVPWEKADSVIRRYSVEYDQFIGESFLETAVELDMLFQAANGKTVNPFGEEVEPVDDDFFEEDGTEESIPGKDRKQEEKVSKQGTNELFPPPKARIQHIWSGSALDDRKPVIKEANDPRKKHSKKATIHQTDVDLIVEDILKRTDKELDLYNVQDKSGINDLGSLAVALNRLCDSGKISRTWSRHRGRYLYRHSVH